MKELKFLILLLIVISSSSLIANPGNEYTTIQLNDSIKTKDSLIPIYKNLVKLDFASLFTGDLTINYERVVSNRLSLEFSFGVNMGYLNEGIMHLIDDNDQDYVLEPESGYSFGMFLRFYGNRTAPIKNYAGFQIKVNSYASNNVDSRQLDLSAHVGNQVNISNRFMFDFNIGLGIRRSTDKVDSLEIRDLEPIIPVAIKLGYLF